MSGRFGAGVLLVDRFEVVDPIAVGGAAYLYRAVDRVADELVVVKVLPNHLPDGDPLQVRFALEASLLGDLHHPHVVRLVHPYTDSAGLRFFVVEYARRGDLGRLAARQPLELPVLLAVVRDVLDALHTVHGDGVVHRDVKPANILVRADMSACLTDFGVAQDAQFRHTVVGDVMGTPGFIAPEQDRDPAAATPLSDLFGVGATLYALATGRPPSDLQVHRLRDKGLARLPDGVRDVIARATEPDPSRRFGSALAMLHRVTDLLDPRP